MKIKLDGVKLEERSVLYNHILGECYSVGYYIKKDLKQAFEYFKKAADQGHPKSQCNIGIIYHHKSDIVNQDLKQAFKYYKMSADQDYMLAIHNLGAC